MPQSVYELKDPQDGSIYEVTMDHQPTPDEARTAVRKFRAIGEAQKAPRSMRPPDATEPVTMGNLMDNPTAAIARMGQMIGHDLSDPKVLAGLLASYVLPKMMGAGAAFRRGVNASYDVAPDAVGVISPRAANAIRVGQKVAGAMRTPNEAPTMAPAPGPSVPMESPLALSQRLRAEHQAAAAAPTAEPAPAPSPVPARTRTPRSAPAAETTPSASAGGQAFELTPEETRMAHQWSQQGINVDVIAKRIVLSRQLTKATGAPSPDAVRQAVAQRNATGKWED